MATVPTGYVFWDVSAKKSYAAGKTFPTLGDGDYLVPASESLTDGYYQQYDYYANSYSSNGVTFSGGWTGMIQDAYRSKSQKAPFNSIAGKPVKLFRYNACTFTTAPDLSSITNLIYVSFNSCKNLTSIPKLPSGLKSINYIGYDCPKLTNINNVLNLTSVISAYQAFYGCTALTSVPSLANMASLTDTRCMFQNCTGLTAASALPPKATDLGWMFKGCTNLVTPPASIPSTVTSIYQMFYGCSKLKGYITIDGDPARLTGYGGCFTNTNKSNMITLLCNTGEYSSAKLDTIADKYDNVFNGSRAKISSFTAVRGDYNSSAETFAEKASGEYLLLTASFTAPYYSSLKMKRPYVYIDGSDTKDTTTTWRLKANTDGSSVSGTTLTTDGEVTVPMSESSGLITKGKILSIIHLGTQSVTKTYKIDVRTAFTYNSNSYDYSTPSDIVQLTYSEYIVDINPSGTGIGIFKDVGDNDEGLFLGSNFSVNGRINATDNISSNGDITAGGEITDGEGYSIPHVEEGTTSITTTTGTLNSHVIARYGRMRMLRLAVQKSSATAVGANLYQGQINTVADRPLFSSAYGSGYYGSAGVLVVIAQDGTITVRVVGAQIAANGSTWCGVTYIAQGD